MVEDLCLLPDVSRVHTNPPKPSNVLEFDCIARFVSNVLECHMMFLKMVFIKKNTALSGLEFGQFEGKANWP